MPGIVGIISAAPARQREDDVDKMLASMMHENYYECGKYRDEALDIQIGWVGLKEPLPCCRFVRNNRQSIVLVYNGENFSEASRHVDSLSDAADIIGLYEKAGEDFPKELNGWFNGLLIDRERMKIVIFNDRYGIKRLYYHQNNDELIFSSEAKAILRIRRQLRQIDSERLGEYFAFGCVLNDKTLFKRIEVLPAGSIWVSTKAAPLRKGRYFKPNDLKVQKGNSAESFFDRLNTTFKKILPPYYAPEDKTGISLTGGLDTRALLSFENGRTQKIPCYTFAGAYADCYDVKVAAKLANAFGQTHSILRLNSDFFSDFPELAQKTVFISDGCHDICGAHDLYFNKLARQIAPIRLTGKFGSEVLRGASTFRELKLDPRIFEPTFRRCVQRAEQENREMFRCKDLEFTCFVDIPYHEFGKLAVEQSQLCLRTPYMDNELIQLLFSRPKERVFDKAITLNLIRTLDPHLVDIPSDLGYNGSGGFSSKLRRLQRSLSFKAEWYFNEGMPHWLSFLNAHGLSKIEKQILGTHKIDHYRKWFKEELAGYIQTELAPAVAGSMPFLDRRYIAKVAGWHIRGKGNYTREINKVITVSTIYQQLGKL